MVMAEVHHLLFSRESGDGNILSSHLRSNVGVWCVSSFFAASSSSMALCTRISHAHPESTIVSKAKERTTYGPAPSSDYHSYGGARVWHETKMCIVTSA
mmetsp:Transcript_6111/g.16655  ORF Transcript_6111/g.16655 Transcript_6111/m.16655 type:complete len:99 (-) Transcript_6111:803-1099(-)